MAWKPFLSRRNLCLVSAAFVLSGCRKQEEIHEYSVPKEPPVRLLAVLVPRDDSTWFFKLIGPASEVAKHVKAFDGFVASVHFTNRAGSPIEWTVPDGWSEEHSDERFYAVLRVAGQSMPLPLTVTRLGPQAKNVRANVDRWRNQIGLDEIAEADLSKLENNIQVDGGKATRVDFIGPGAGKGIYRGDAVPPRRPFTFAKPKAWEELPADSVKGFRREAVFRVGEGAKTAQTTVMRFNGDGGGDLMNVNRWRGELGLEPAKEEDLRRDLRALKSASGPARYIELSSRGKGEAKATLGAWLAHGGQTWFITMKGPADVVRAQQPAFEAFVQSFRFDSGAGAAHE